MATLRFDNAANSAVCSALHSIRRMVPTSSDAMSSRASLPVLAGTSTALCSPYTLSVRSDRSVASSDRLLRVRNPQRDTSSRARSDRCFDTALMDSSVIGDPGMRSTFNFEHAITKLTTPSSVAAHIKTRHPNADYVPVNLPSRVENSRRVFEHAAAMQARDTSLRARSSDADMIFMLEKFRR